MNTIVLTEDNHQNNESIICDHIEQMIILTSDSIKRLSLHCCIQTFQENANHMCLCLEIIFSVTARILFKAQSPIECLQKLREYISRIIKWLIFDCSKLHYGTLLHSPSLSKYSTEFCTAEPKFLYTSSKII